MPYSTNIPYYQENMYRETMDRRPMPPRPPMGPGNRPIGFGGSFLLPFALGFATSPLVLGPRPPYYGPGPYYGPRPPYFPYY